MLDKTGNVALNTNDWLAAYSFRAYSGFWAWSDKE